MADRILNRFYVTLDLTLLYWTPRTLRLEKILQEFLMFLFAAKRSSNSQVVINFAFKKGFKAKRYNKL